MSFESVIDRLRRDAAQAPTAEVFGFYDDDAVEPAVLDRAGMVAAADAIAGWLRDEVGLAPGDRAVLVYPPSTAFVTAFVGCLAAGVIPVPVYPPNPLAPARDAAAFARVVEDCGATAALTCRSYDRMRRIGAVRGLLGGARLPTIGWWATDRIRPGDFAPPPPRRVAPDEVALLQYTSGSTSAPKGVRITHGNVAHQLAFNREALGLGPEARAVFWVPQYHDFGLISGILSAIGGNGRFTMFSPLSFLARPGLWFDRMTRERATHTAAPNFAYELAVRKTTADERARWDLSALRVVMSAAEPVRPDTVRRFLDAFAVSGLRPDAVCPAYGLAEHTVGVTIGGRATVGFDRTALERGRRALVAGALPAEQVTELAGCGRAPADIDVRIVDPDTRRALPDGRIGEIWVDSPSKADGYWGRPELSAATFAARLADDEGGRGFLRTGDLGFLHEGELFVCGRAKDLVIVAGRNVYPEDVEASVRGCHPAIRPGKVAAFGVEDPDAPEAGERLVVLVEARSDRIPASERRAIAAAVRRTVAEEHGLSCLAVLVGREGAVRKTTSGKVRRAACRDAWLAGELSLLLDDRDDRDEDSGALGGRADPLGPAVAAFRAAEDPERRRQAAEDVLRRLVAAALGASVEAVDPRRPLVELGVGSLALIEVCEAASSALGAPVPLDAAFGRGDLAAIAAAVVGVAPPPIEADDAPPEAPGTYPVSPEQARLLRHQAAHGGGSLTVPVAARVAELDPRVVRARLDAAVARHAALRTVFAPDGDGWLRRVLPAIEVPLHVAEVADDALDAALADAQAPLDPAAGPLLRVGLLALPDGARVLYVVLHHLIADLRAARLLLGELLGDPQPAGERSADLVARERAREADRQLDAALRARLAAPSTGIPTDRPRRGVAAHPAISRAAVVPELGARLLDGAGALGAPPAAVLLAAFAATVRALSDDDRRALRVGVPWANRAHPGAAAAIGLYARLSAVTLDLPADARFADLVRSAHEALTAGEDGPSFGEVAAVVRAGPQPVGEPVVQAVFSFVHDGGAAVDLLPVGRPQIDFELFLTTALRGRDLVVQLELAADLFTADTAARVLALFRATVAEALARPRDGLDAIARAAGAPPRTPIAIAATFTAEPIAAPLAFWAGQLDRRLPVTFAPHDQVFQQLLDPRSALSTTDGLAVVLLRLSDWSGAWLDDGRLRDPEGFDAAIAQDVARFLESVALRPRGAPILVVGCPEDPARLDPIALERLAAHRDRLADGIRAIPGAAWLDGDAACAAYDVARPCDPVQDALARIPYGPEGFAALATAVVRHLEAARPRCKIVVVDCDHTLWNGVVGEDGPDGVVIDGGRRSLQRFLVDLQASGVLVALCSKNRPEDVDAALRRPDMVLRPEHVVARQVSWAPKSEGLRAIAEELGLGLDSFVFLDDSPVECAEVRAALPEVLALQLPADSDAAARFVRHVWALDRPTVSEEDRRRTALYRAEAARTALRREAGTFADFLAALDLRVEVAEPAPADLARVAQLTWRTNQLNANGRRRDEAELAALLDAGARGCRVVRVRDRFGDHGLVGVLLFADGADPAEGGDLVVDGFLLSCRVLGRGVEHAMLRWLGERAVGNGAGHVAIAVRATERNEPFRRFLAEVCGPLGVAVPDQGDRAVRIPAAAAAAARISTVGAAPRRASARAVAPSTVDPAQVERVARLDRAAAILAAMGEPAVEPAADADADATEAIARAFAVALGVPRVGADDDLFALGGDSIVAVRVVAEAARAGLALTLEDVHRHGTPARLAAVARPAAPAWAPAAGDAPLTPVQRWFFAGASDDPRHWNMSLAVDLAEGVDERRLAAAIDAVVAHHDALRARFVRDGAGWRQGIGPHEGCPVEVVDVVDEAHAEREAAARQADLDLSGHLFRPAILRLGDGGRRLLLVAHHLVIDGVSLRILLEDLERVYDQLGDGHTADPGRRTAPLPAWSAALEAWATTDEAGALSSRWAAAMEGWAPASLPVDGPDPAATPREGDAEVVEARLDPARTRALLGEVHAAWGTDAQDFLLAAVLRACAERFGDDTLLLDVEGHGRDALDLDVSRTVGWFTAVHPLRLRAPADPDPRALLVAVKGQRRAAPGAPYGALRFLRRDPALLRAEEAVGAPPIGFNYLGQLDRTLVGSRLFRWTDAPIGPQRGAAEPRRHLLDVLAYVVDGALRIGWTWSPTHHRRETVEALASRTIEVLGELVAHARRGREGIEDAHPLTPMQAGMLLHALASPGSDLLFLQWRIRLDGPVDGEALRGAFDDVVARHPALRSAFSWEGLDAPLQRVRSAVTVPWDAVDLRDLAAPAREARVAALLDADRRRGFALDEAPLMRLTLVRLADDAHLLVWSHHHLVLDGWSEAVVLREVAACYEARLAGVPAALRPAAPFRAYVDGLQRADDADAARHWAATLADLPDLRLPTGRGAPVEAEVALDADRWRRLDEAARARRLTLATLVQGSWARVLAHLHGADEVVFGAAVAHRPAEVPGADGIVGVLLANLPVRARVSGEGTVEERLADLQAALAAGARRGHLPPDRLAALAGRPGRPLFDSLVVVQNLAGGPTRLGGATVRALDHEVRVGLPLALVAEPSLDGSLRIRLRSEGAALDEARLGAILDAVVGVLGDLPGWLDAPVDRWRAPLALPRLDAASAPTSAGRPPSTPTERALADLFADVLGAPVVHADDDFFDLGGGSLSALDLVRRIEERFAVALPIPVFLSSARTVAAAALWLDRVEVERSATDDDYARLARMTDDEVRASLEALS